EDVAEEVEKEAEPLPKKPTQPKTPPLKAYKPKFSYPQRLNKEKIEARYAKFLDMIKEVKINVPLVDVLARMPNYGKFLKDLVSNKSKMEQISAAFLTEECSTILQNKISPKLGDPGSFLIPCKHENSVEYLALADLGASINLMSYLLYAALSGTTLKPTRMSIRLANHTYQYPMGVAENMLVQVVKFMFPVDFVILVKNKELTLRIGEDRATFYIDKAIQHSHVNDDTCFRMDVIDDIIEDELDALLDGSKPFLNTSEKISETPLDKEFDEFMSKNVQEDEIKDDFEKLPPEDELRIRKSIQDPPTDLEMKPLPKHLEYAFLEENSLLPLVISALLEQNEKERLVSVLKNHKEAFAWKTSDIPGISPSFCKHKINLEDDVKPVIYRQRRLNPNMKEVIKKRLLNFYTQDTLKTSMEVFMDDFLVFGYSFDSCLYNLEYMLIRCKQGHLVLNWEKCHFMVTEGIVLGYKVSHKGLEVNKAKIDVIAKLPPPTNVKAVRSFLGHAGFYRRFIKDFSKISRTMMKLLEKDSIFNFDEECNKAFETLKEKLTNAPIMVSPNWSLPFELMCDASDFAVGSVLGQRKEKHFRPIHFASKTLNSAQQNYTLTQKKLLVIVFAFDKFRSYLVLSKIVVFTDHAAIKYLFSKQDAKPCLIRWILLLQEFDIEIKNKKGAENVATDHLSRLEKPNLNDEEINDEFLDEFLMSIKTDEEESPWFADFANYLVGGILRKGLTYAQHCKFFSELKHYFWDEPYLFKACPDGMIKRCVHGSETQKILDECHHGPTGGHYGPLITVKKVFDAGFY
ncbi:reverse transcriptase domain-containing protein, partial [Tanacetum coccineum]